ncbi:MAG TPA: FAD-dependent monooxygenase [Gemmatimonadales bacterium]
MQPADLLVVGAGPAGSATAIRAARAGLSVVLVDRARFPREKICAEYMSPETLRHLDLLGVLAEIDQAGGMPLAGTTVVGPRGSRLTGLFDRAGSRPFRPTGLSLPRRVLDDCLLRAAGAAGVTVLEGRTVTDLLYDEGAVAGAAARDQSGQVELLRSRLTVGADGLRSVVAGRLGVRHHGFPARVAFVAHVAGVLGLSDRAEMHVGQGGYLGLNPLGPDVTNVALVVARKHAAAARGDPTGFFAQGLGRFEAVRDRVDPRRIVREVLVTGPFAARARRVTAGGALLVGDAADFFDPFTGEGICSALKGAELAATTAVAALASPGRVSRERLRGYEAARRVSFRGKWAVERLIGWGMLVPALFDRAIGRLEARGWAHTLIGVTGDFVPAGAVLNPRFLSGMLW